MKKKIFAICLSAMLINGLNASVVSSVVSGVAGSVANSFLSKLDSTFNNLFSSSLSLINACLGTNWSLSFDTTDPCAFASNLNFKINICGSLNTGINGFETLCKSYTRKFTEYVAKNAIDQVEYAFMMNDTLSSIKGSLPNGSTIRKFNGVWNINTILSKAKNSKIANYLRDGKHKEVELAMNYAKYSGSEYDPASIDVDNIQAPATLDDYQLSVGEAILQHKALIRTASPSGTSASARSLFSSDSSASTTTLLQNTKAEYDQAKIAELGRLLAISDYKKIAIPTQEYVELLRPDVRLQAIAQIQKQQAYEVAVAAQVEEKWNRKYTIAQLLIDKEQILAQEFDEDSAQSEVDSIAEGS